MVYTSNGNYNFNSADMEFFRKKILKAYKTLKEVQQTNIVMLKRHKKCVENKSITV